MSGHLLRARNPDAGRHATRTAVQGPPADQRPLGAEVGTKQFRSLGAIASGRRLELLAGDRSPAGVDQGSARRPARAVRGRGSRRGTIGRHSHGLHGPTGTEPDSPGSGWSPITVTDRGRWSPCPSGMANCSKVGTGHRVPRHEGSWAESFMAYSLSVIIAGHPRRNDGLQASAAASPPPWPTMGCVPDRPHRKVTQRRRRDDGRYHPTATGDHGRWCMGQSFGRNITSPDPAATSGRWTVPPAATATPEIPA